MLMRPSLHLIKHLFCSLIKIVSLEFYACVVNSGGRIINGVERLVIDRGIVVVGAAVSGGASVAPQC